MSMAANTPGRMSAPAPGAALWLAFPEDPRAWSRRDRAADTAIRDSLFRHLEALGHVPARGPLLSHAGGHAAYFCGSPLAVGVDLEWVRERDVVSLADFAYASGELAYLEGLASDARNAAFIDLWVLKEAAGKVLRLDLFGALSRCRFEIANGRITGSIPGAEPWQAAIYAPRPALRLGYVAVRAPGAAAPPRPRCEWPMVPACFELSSPSGHERHVAWPCVARGGGGSD